MMRRVAAIVVAAALASCALVITSGSTASANEISDERRLAAKYAPVLKLVRQPKPCGPGEPYLPSDVDILMDNSSIALRGPWTQSDDLVSIAPSADDLSDGLPDYALDMPGNPLKPGCSYEKWADANWEGVEPTIYAHVATQDDAPGRLALQYWFYYPFNDYNNKHESDWERIQVEFDADDAAQALQTDPVRVSYSQHYGAEHADWGSDDLELRGGTHPVVYVAEGSHASHLSPALFLGRSGKQGFGCDTTLPPHKTLRPVVKTIPLDPDLAVKQFPWIGYEGKWGQHETQEFYDGPTGPNVKDQWTAPFTWADSGNNKSHPVPGGGILDNAATDTFCRAVSKGSDVYLDFTRNPQLALGVLGVILIIIVWLVRRTNWSAEPLPALRRRVFGQVVSSSLKMYARHPLLFLGIGLLPMIVSAFTTLVQQLIYGNAVTFEGGAPRVEIRDWVDFISFAHALLLVLSVLVAHAAVSQALLELDAGEASITVRDVYRHALTRTWALFRTFLAYLVFLAVAGILLDISIFLLPVFLLLAVMCALFVPVLQIEQTAGFRALRRSWQLVWPQVFRVAALLLFSAFVTIVIGAIPSTIVILAFQAPFAVVNLLPGMVFTLTVPFFALVSTYLYYNGRARELENEAAAEEPRDPNPVERATA